MSDDFKYKEYKNIGEFHIFNQEDFSKKNQLSPKDSPARFREGSKHDVAKLKSAAQLLGFECNEKTTIHTNFNKEEIQRKLIKLSEQDFSDSYCFACAILTHGGTKGRLATSDDEINISKFEKEIRENKFLIGKPKLFFIQACRGIRKDPGIKLNDVEDEHTDDYIESPTGDQDNEDICIPTGSDFLFYHSTMDDYSASLNPKKGSIFIQKLSKNLVKYGREWDLLKILTRVNHDVAVESKEGRKQIPVISSRLRKEVYFRTRIETTPVCPTEGPEVYQDVKIHPDSGTECANVSKSFVENPNQEENQK